MLVDCYLSLVCLRLSLFVDRRVLLFVVVCCCLLLMHVGDCCCLFRVVCSLMFGVVCLGALFVLSWLLFLDCVDCCLFCALFVVL